MNMNIKSNEVFSNKEMAMLYVQMKYNIKMELVNEPCIEYYFGFTLGGTYKNPIKTYATLPLYTCPSYYERTILVYQETLKETKLIETICYK